MYVVYWLCKFLATETEKLGISATRIYLSEQLLAVVQLIEGWIGCRPPHPPPAPSHHHTESNFKSHHKLEPTSKYSTASTAVKCSTPEGPP